MNTKKLFSLPQILFGAIIVVVILSFKGDDKDPLHKRIFYVNLTEVKDGVVGKRNILDEFEFKNGKMFSDYLYDKFGYKWIRYRINKDSVYTDSTETKVRRLDVEATFNDESGQTVMINFINVEWDLEGSIKIVAKNDKIKKYFDITGFEKGGPPEKQKKKKKNPNDTIPLFQIKKE